MKRPRTDGAGSCFGGLWRVAASWEASASLRVAGVIPRFQKNGVFYSQVASPGAVWEWNRLVSFPDSRKMAFSIPKSPLKGQSGNGIACYHSQIPEKRRFLFPSRLSKGGLGMDSPSVISQILKISHFCYPMTLQRRLGNKTPGFHFPNPEIQPFLLPDDSPALVGKQNSRFSFPKSRKPAISVTRCSPSAGWEIARRSPQHKTRRQSRRAEITDARGRRPSPLSRSPSGNSQRRLR